MSVVTGTLRARASMLTATALVAALFGFAREPALSEEEQAQLASRFAFARSELAEPPGARPPRYVREVHPSLKRISAWISSVGAAIALADIDGDGRANDICRVEPRTDTVIVEPAPGTGARYEPFPLTAYPLRYDEATMAPMGCMANDVNEDGLMDLLVYYWGRTPVIFLRQTGEPGVQSAIMRSDFVATDLVLTGERWYTNAAFFADLDGDGHVDLLIGNYFQDGAHILDVHAAGVEAMHSTKSKSFNGGHKHLLLWDGAKGAPAVSVRFREVHRVFSEEVDRGWLLAAGAADLDGDLRPEIYFAHDFGPDRLLHNESTPGNPRFVALDGTRGFTTPASMALGHDSFKGMGVDFGDVNGDGLFDIYVSNIADRFALQESHFLWLSTGDTQGMAQGRAPYVHGAEGLGLSRSGWGWDARLADLDNDGRLEAMQATGFIRGRTNRWPELQALGTGNDQLMTNPGNWPGFRPGDDLSGDDRFAFFVRGRTGRFWNIGPSVGFAEPMVSRGIALADVDGDGRLDFAVANQWEPSFFYHNDSPSAGEFLGLHLLLPIEPGKPTRSREGHPGPDLHGRPAIGASVRVHGPDGSLFVGQVDGGNGHSGKRSPDVHIGLGAVDRGTPLAVEIAWRDPEGNVHRETLHLVPGWHTVVLGWPSQGASS